MENAIKISEGTISPQEAGFKLVDGGLEEEIVKEVYKAMEDCRDESFGIFDLTVVAERFRLWKECFPNIQPHYAVKANNDPVILKLLSLLGGSFDCATKEEIKGVLDIGVKPDDIVFASPIKFPSHLRFATENGISLMTFDSQMELSKIKEHAPKARLLLRIKPVMTGVAQTDLDRKFGCSSDNSRRLLREARSLGLRVVGVSFHVGSGCDDPTPYTTSIQSARKIFDISSEEGIKMDMLDIGGGFYGNNHAEHALRRMCRPINAVLDSLFPRSSKVKIISEPGRFFVESGLTVASCIIGRKETKDEQDIKSRADGASHETKHTSGSGCLPKVGHQSESINSVYQYYLSESIYGALQMYWFDKKFDYRPKPVRTGSSDGPMFMSTLWGPTCDSLDLIQEGCYLPLLWPNDWLAFPNLGAYCICLASPFNGVPVLPIQRIMNRKIWDELRS